MANTPNASFPRPYITSPSFTDSALVNAHDYSPWYQPPQPQPQVQEQQSHEEHSYEPTPEPDSEPISFQPPASPRSLRNMYEQLPPLQASIITPPLDSTTRNRLRRERAKERERQRPGISALLPDEIIIEPPHDPDEKVPTPHVRSCSMARQDVPQGMRCVVLLRVDYDFRMCQGCRMRFKLAEVRSKGIRYQGKFKARGDTEDARGSKYSKPRPYLIQYKDELILDPAFMHLYELDPRMFGPEAAQLSSARNEENKFLAALKAAEAAAGLKSSEREDSIDIRRSAEPTGLLTPLPTPVIDSELARAMPHLTGVPSSNDNMPGTSSSTQGLAGRDTATRTNSPREQPDDGLLRVRICSVKNCHNIVPIDYAWKMCASCRDNYKTWGVGKRARQRERKLQKMSPEKRERFERVSKERARKEAEEEGIMEEFDPTVPPKPCSIPHCKNHLPGNIPWSRCSYHRLKDGAPYRDQLAKKRENPRQIFNKAVEEGRDPVEAIKEFLLRKEEEKNQSHGSDGDEGKDTAKGKRKRSDENAAPNEDANEEQNGIPKRMRRPAGMSICGGMKCSNLLSQDTQHKLCELCRDRDAASHPPKVKKPRQDPNTDSPFKIVRFVVNPVQPRHPNEGINVASSSLATSAPINPFAQTRGHQQPEGTVGGSAFSPNDTRNALTTEWSGVVDSHAPTVGWTDYYAQYNSHSQSFKTAESSLQGAIVFDSRNDNSAPSGRSPSVSAPLRNASVPAALAACVSPSVASAGNSASDFQSTSITSTRPDSFRTQTTPPASDQQASQNATSSPPKSSSGRQASRHASDTTAPAIDSTTTTVPNPPSPSTALAEAIAKAVAQLPASSFKIVASSTSASADSSKPSYSTPIADAIARAVSTSATLSNMIANVGASSSDALANAIAKAVSALPVPPSTNAATASSKSPVNPPPPHPTKRQYKKRGSNKSTSSAGSNSQQSHQAQASQPHPHPKPSAPSPVQTAYNLPSTGVYPYGYMHYPPPPPNSYPPYPPPPQHGSPGSSMHNTSYPYPAYPPHMMYPPPNNNLPGQAGQSQSQHPYPSYQYPFPYRYPYTPQPGNEPSSSNHLPLLTASVSHPVKFVATPAQGNALSTDTAMPSTVAHPPKICELPKCNRDLPPNYPHKHCSDCRKKLKAKKKVAEMKRRLKLGGN